MAAEVSESFYKAFVNSLHEGTAAIFAGAGLSRASGYVDWRGLLKDIAEELGLDVKLETDLIAVAQYNFNKSGGRGQLNRAIIEEFTKDAKLTENHRLIANLPLNTVWTTNYDSLLEDAFKAARKRVDAKISSRNLVGVVPGRAVTIYKMHGDASQPHDAVITKEDYETYDTRHGRGLFSIKLKGDLVGRTFLFLGFSFTDPNIDYILGRIRGLLGQDVGNHYCVLRRPEKPKGGGKKKADYEYEARKLDLRIDDLKRYGIVPLMVDNYSDITEILRELNRRIHLRDVFVSGSAYDFKPFGQDKLEGLARLIGRSIIDTGCNLISGVGLGIGGQVILGALGSVYGSDSGVDPGDRMTLRPFPQQSPENMTLPEFWTKYRRDMISKAGVAIFIAGNKTDGSDKVVEANGMMEEFKIAKQHKLYPIPIGATGWTAQAIWQEVSDNLASFYPDGGVKAQFAVLGDPKKTNVQLVEAVIAVLRHIKAF